MSIKDLFERSTVYVSEKNDKEAFADAESSRNVKAIAEKQTTFEPQIDYSFPSAFAKFGSAELYYKSAIDRIIDYYPYDGSDAEYNEFYNKSLDIEKYIFNNLYPRTNGYVNFSNSYISLKGGPHTISTTSTKDLFKDPRSSQRETANIYDEDLYTTEGLPSDYGEGTRESNLLCDFTKGITVELWLKSDELATNTKQGLFHLTNSAGANEFTLYLSGTSGSPFRLNYAGTVSGTDVILSSSATTSSISSWTHFAVSVVSASTGFVAKTYLNGVQEYSTVINSTSPDQFTQEGTLAYIASGSATDGHLYFSGSMDEFRFWKAERTAQDIGRNWFGQVRGGSNTDISNTTLGVYYKFNEGITGITEQDSIVLDYSGRISNGTFSGYNSSSRNTGSAIVLAGAATKEYLDPIIYANHPQVSSLKTELVNKGIDHDYRNTSLFSSFMPSWVAEEHEELGNTNFKYLSHIIGTYFDRLYLQIEALPTFKSPIYTSSSYKPLPFAANLPSSLGLDTPEIFIDSTIMEKFLNRNEKEAFEFDLEETKNLIYLNLYNNLTYIYKSKGTEKAVKNVLRTFNIDDKLVRFNTYANNYVYELENNLKQTLLKKSSVNFNRSGNTGAVVYSTGSGNSTQLGYISGSGDTKYEERYGLTHEVDVVFPKFVRYIDTFERDFTRVSLFGMHSASANTSETTIFDPSMYVYAEREEPYSKNVKFVLSSSLLTTEISSSNFLNVYDDENWNLSVRIKPVNIGLTGSVDGASTGGYEIYFSGYNQRLGEIRNSFTISSSISSEPDAKAILNSPKRIFMGAHRTNLTGALQYKSDVLVSSVRFWTRFVDETTLQQHAFDFENYGITEADKHLSPLDSDNERTLNRNTLALNYEFGDITGSDSGGAFTVADISSGSVENRTKFGKLGEISSYLYPAVGFGFEESSVNVVQKREVNVNQFIDPELAISDNLVQVRTDDDKLFDTVDTIPNYHYILEKSMYASISEEMLNFFAGVNDFHNLIGHPVHQYRMNYKGLEKLREVFFRRVTTVSDVEKFVDYYKWFDDAISSIVSQLVPASADYTSDVLNTVESHVLERNKYQYRIPMLAFTSSTEGVIFGAEELQYNWNRNHAPVSGLERDNSNWWKDRAERQGTISSGDSTVDSQRNQIRRVQTNQTNGGVGRSFTNTGTKYSRSNFKYRTLSKGRVFEAKQIKEIKGGVNFEHNKDIHYTYTALHPAGPINQDDGVFVPKNVLLGFTSDLVELQDSSDAPENPAEKVKRNILVQHGRDWEDGIGYKNVKSSKAFPFNIVSSSVRSGYNAHVIARATASIEITNIHNDVYGPDMERPMQGPFTDYAVGGHQSRHIKLNTGGDNYLNRPEAWKIALGKCPNTDGAIGMVGADYPYPEANEIGESPYPLTGAQKATYYRDEIAKRPVNIRNIQHRTGSTILGNYNHNYEVVHAVGGYSNPRAFIDEQPSLPSVAEGADVVKTILDLNRGERNHFVFVDDYDAGYLTGSAEYKNKTIIVNRFSSPGSRESSTRAFKDFRASEFSVYNTINNRNLTSRRAYQGVTSSIVSETEGIRSFDHTGRDFGFTNLAARHTGKFFRDSVFQTNPAASDNAFQEEPSFHKIHRNNKIFAIDEDQPTVEQKYDNLNVQHQIPRSDRQYSWITSSIIHTDPEDPRYAGFMLTDSGIAPYYDITGTLVPYFEYVSASGEVSGIYQNTTRINLLTSDETGSAINTLGQTTIGSALQTLPEGERLNALLVRRGDIYGWNWRTFHQKDHPILKIEHSNNRLTALKGTELKDFRMPPVSMKGRPIVVNMDAQGQNISLKATHNNEKIYFNERELNDLVYEKQDTTVTPFDQLMDMSSQPGNELNWVHYSEALFPSTRNEFVSSSRERIGYSNGFWRDSGEDRLTFERNSFNINVSQSIWSLDPQEDFLTRTSIVYASPVDDEVLINNGKAGELQNNYTTYHTGTGAPNSPIRRQNLRAGSLMSRKQLLTSPNSVVSRTGFALTGSLTDTFTDQIPNYAGEALWEAGTHATIIEKSGSSFITSSQPSEPWFDEYGDFKEELQLMAKDYSIVPEFRISEHISDYIKGGLFNKSKQDTFEIPGTSFDSSQENFYKDYSNSDFLKEFAEIKQKSGLAAKEIMLTCKAAIRYNPYKGFYPAQRTINLAEQFNSSYSQGFSKTEGSGFLGSSLNNSRYLRPLIQPLFAPGIVYNSIKSGIAVDYPVINSVKKIQSYNFSGSSTDSENYMIWPAGIRQANLTSDSYGSLYNPNRPFWDFRVPFEAALEPGKHIDKIEFKDFEPHPSCSFNATASMDASVSDGIYELMSRNFFGQTGEFFLKDSGFTKLHSDIIQDGLKFKNNEVYAARLKIRKSHNGNRFYNLESGSDGTNTYFSNLGAAAYSGSGTSLEAIDGFYYPLPQDPAHNPNFEETFTMYSRPTAFGPSVTGRQTGSHDTAFLSGTLDSLEGYNWAYTPPYYHGESWVDFIFRPDSSKTYTLEDILTETETVYWRVDPGQMTGSEIGNTSFRNERLLIQNGYSQHSQSFGIGFTDRQAPYGGSVVNDNAMQLNSSLNLFGIERIPKKRKDKFNNTILNENDIAGKRWVIQPKWETPMLNFANVQSGSGNITYPTTFSESVPRGMWHQFGEIPEDPATGVFLEMGDIPTDWLRGHYDVINEDSVYNNNDAANSGSTAHQDIKSLSDLFGFSRAKKKDSANVRLGEIADKREVYEAVVAIPYIIEANEDYQTLTGNDKKNRKKFISIPRARFESALKEREGSKDGDSLQAAGESIRKMVQKMKRYVLPPQFDFINFDEIEPMVMYFFEFKYEFDKDDLSYIWQNLAPREYKKITFQQARVAHDLMNNELLEESNLMDNPNLRWMVFKVKQKAGKDYYDLIAPQVKAARLATKLDKPDTDKDDEYLQFNWPYDYLSFVELVKLEADVLYKADDEVPE
jgi:hypothetical protein